MGFINRGNLVLYGTRNWGPMNAAAAPTVSAAAAEATVAAHLAPFTIAVLPQPDPPRDRAHRQHPAPRSRPGRGGLRLPPGLGGDASGWPATSAPGKAWSTPRPARCSASPTSTTTPPCGGSSGGVLPISNDGIVPDGVEQPGYPMPFADILLPDTTTTYTTSGGALGCVDGTIKTTLSRQVRQDERQLRRRSTRARPATSTSPRAPAPTAPSPPATRPATPTPRAPASTRSTA